MDQSHHEHMKESSNRKTAAVNYMLDFLPLRTFEVHVAQKMTDVSISNIENTEKQKCGNSELSTFWKNFPGQRGAGRSVNSLDAPPSFTHWFGSISVLLKQTRAVFRAQMSGRSLYHRKYCVVHCS